MSIVDGVIRMNHGDSGGCPVWDGSEPSGEVRVHLAPVNGETGVVVTAGAEPISALVLDVADDMVRVIRVVANPEKLARLRGIETTR